VLRLACVACSVLLFCNSHLARATPCARSSNVDSIAEYEGRDIPCAGSASVTDSFSSQCPLPGEEVIESIGIHGITESFWFNVGMVILLQFLFRIGAYILLRRSKQR
jgi:hypothetical protein